MMIRFVDKRPKESKFAKYLEDKYGFIIENDVWLKDILKAAKKELQYESNKIRKNNH